MSWGHGEVMMILNDLRSLLFTVERVLHHTDNFAMRYHYVIYPVKILSILRVNVSLPHARKVHAHVPTTVGVPGQ